MGKYITILTIAAITLAVLLLLTLHNQNEDYKTIVQLKQQNEVLKAHWEVNVKLLSAERVRRIMSAK